MLLQVDLDLVADAVKPDWVDESSSRTSVRMVSATGVMVKAHGNSRRNVDSGWQNSLSHWTEFLKMSVMHFSIRMIIQPDSSRRDEKGHPNIKYVSSAVVPAIGLPNAKNP